MVEGPKTPPVLKCFTIIRAMKKTGGGGGPKSNLKPCEIGGKPVHDITRGIMGYCNEVNTHIRLFHIKHTPVYYTIIGSCVVLSIIYIQHYTAANLLYRVSLT